MQQKDKKHGKDFLNSRDWYILFFTFVNYIKLYQKMNIEESIEKFVEEILANEDNELKIIDLAKIETEFSQKIIEETEEDLNNFLV